MSNEPQMLQPQNFSGMYQPPMAPAFLPQAAGPLPSMYQPSPYSVSRSPAAIALDSIDGVMDGKYFGLPILDGGYAGPMSQAPMTPRHFAGPGYAAAQPPAPYAPPAGSVHRSTSVMRGGPFPYPADGYLGPPMGDNGYNGYTSQPNAYGTTTYTREYVRPSASPPRTYMREYISTPGSASRMLYDGPVPPHMSMQHGPPMHDEWYQPPPPRRQYDAGYDAPLPPRPRSRSAPRRPYDEMGPYTPSRSSTYQDEYDVLDRPPYRHPSDAGREARYPSRSRLDGPPPSHGVPPRRSMPLERLDREDRDDRYYGRPLPNGPRRDPRHQTMDHRRPTEGAYRSPGRRMAPPGTSPYSPGRRGDDFDPEDDFRDTLRDRESRFR